MSYAGVAGLGQPCLLLSSLRAQFCQAETSLFEICAVRGVYIRPRVATAKVPWNLVEAAAAEGLAAQ
jgi:hypothetical protein